MKQFNLNEYLANPKRKIITRDGKNVRIVCTNRRASHPIIALVEDGDYDIAATYQENGKYINDSSENKLDLFFIPTRHEGWMNLYYGFCVINGSAVYKSEKQAKEIANNNKEGYISTIKVEWED